MAWILVKTVPYGNSTHLTEWQIDSASDIANASAAAGAAPGSTAYTADGSHTYRKSNAGVWTEVVTGSGGGGANMTIVELNTQTGVLDTTAGAILAASKTGPVVLRIAGGGAENISSIIYAKVDSENYTFYFVIDGADVVFAASGEDAYPSVCK